MDDEPRKVKITGINIPMGDLINLGVKVGIAAIPVAIMLGLLYAVAGAFFAGMSGCGEDLAKNSRDASAAQGSDAYGSEADCVTDCTLVEGEKVECEQRYVDEDIPTDVDSICSEFCGGDAGRIGPGYGVAADCHRKFGREVVCASVGETYGEECTGECTEFRECMN